MASVATGATANAIGDLVPLYHLHYWFANGSLFIVSSLPPLTPIANGVMVIIRSVNYHY
jgi:hypothetical protein